MELAPAVEGMIHLSELSWSRVGAADEAVSPGDLVRVKVLGISKNDKGQIRISLSRKQAEGDPWLDAPERLRPRGAVVQGKVVRGSLWRLRRAAARRGRPDSCFRNVLGQAG